MYSGGRLCRLCGAVLIAAHLLAPVRAMSVECPLTSADLVRVLETELKDRGILYRALPWGSRIVQIDSRDQIFDYLDLPILSAADRPVVTIGNAAQSFYDFSVPTRAALSQTGVVEKRLTRELLLRSTLLYRLTKNPVHLDSRFSRWMEQYYEHATALARALDRARQNADEAQVAQLTRQVHAELERWNRDFRAVLAVAQQKLRFLSSYETAGWWESAHQQFVASGAPGASGSPRAALIPVDSTLNGAHTVSYSCEYGNRNLRYETFSVARTWLDPGGFAYLSWQWSAPGPVATRTFSAVDCDAHSQLGCVASKIAILQEVDDNELPRAEFLALFGTGLPATPREDTARLELSSGAFRFDYSYRRLVERLRGGTF